MFQTPHPKFRSYDAADAELDDPAEIKFSDDEEEAEFLRREAATGTGRAGAGVGQVRTLVVAFLARRARAPTPLAPHALNPFSASPGARRPRKSQREGPWRALGPRPRRPRRGPARLLGPTGRPSPSALRHAPQHVCR